MEGEKKANVLDLVDALEWRVNVLHYLNLYAGSGEAESHEEEIRTCSGMMILDIARILERKGG